MQTAQHKEDPVPPARAPNAQNGFCTPRSSFCTPQNGFCTPKTSFCTPQNGSCTPQSGFCTPQSGFCTPRSGFCTPQSGFCTQPRAAHAHPRTLQSCAVHTFEFADTRSGILRAHAVHTFLAGRNLAESQSRAPGATRNLDFACKIHGFHADVARRSKKATRRIAKCRFKSRPACQSKRPTLQNANVERRGPQPFTANEARRILYNTI